MNTPPSITRRRFLQAAAVAPVCTALGAESFAPPLAVFDKVCQEAKLTLEQSAETVAAAGLDGVDCAARPGGQILPERAADDLPRYERLLRQRGARLLLLTTAITGVATPHAETLLRTARKLGVTHYRLGYWPHRPDTTPAALIGKIRGQLKELAALNREIGVCALFQNHSAGARKENAPAGGDLGELRAIMQDLPPEQIAVAFDPGHALLTHGDGWPAHFEALQPWIKVAYIKDAKRGAGFVPFGQGELGRTDLFRRLRAMRYAAPLSVHIEYPWTPKNQPALVRTLTETRGAVAQWLKDA